MLVQEGDKINISLRVRDKFYNYVFINSISQRNYVWFICSKRCL